MKNPTDETLAIFSFNITCMFYNSNIEKFVSTAIKLRVQNLTIDLSHRDLPQILIRSKTLVFLKLKKITLKKNLSSIYLPSLKALHMESVTFSEYKYLTKILSGCPVMEELETKDLMVEKNYRVSMGEAIYFSNLVRANISGEHILYA